ncbi:unnamed protein product [Allacma fusca]|uniref:2'-5'-oligoadenylate synthetase 1 domain-containing protein n=1 Tax=Allacma fusca TaxID=39272 RepID=A0A8J2JYD6_9HEXA|nr:unnamed protein product [Allacma fusca]
MYPLLNRDLKDLANAELDNLHSYKTAGRAIFERVYKTIVHFSPYRISRYVLAGSMGKNISLGLDFQPDFDFVIFVREVTPPLKPVVDEFYRILETQLPSNCAEWNVFDPFKMTKTSYSIKFLMTTVIETSRGRQKVHMEFDLLPAISFARDIAKQTGATLGAIRRTKNPRVDWNHYSTALCENTIRFVRDQPPFTHSVIRLAKLWDSKLKVELQESGNKFHFSGRSSVIELIAIHAANLQEKKANLLEAFRRFLNLIENIDDIQINFCNSTIYPKDLKPGIFDSINPYNNYADKIDPVSKQLLKERARSTLYSLTSVAKITNESDYATGFASVKMTYLVKERNLNGGFNLYQ